jgi:hypothetical protein
MCNFQRKKKEDGRKEVERKGDGNEGKRRRE